MGGTIVELPQSKRLRRLVVSFAGLCLMVIVLSQYFLVPELFARDRPDAYEITHSLLGSLAATLLAALVATLFLLWLYPEESQPDSAVRVVSNAESNALFKDLRLTSTNWSFSGGLGRWVRAEVLPDLGRRGADAGEWRQAQLVILDPRDERQCSIFASVRRGARSTKVEMWTVRKVQEELVTTMLVVSNVMAQYPRLQVQVALHANVSIVRFDVSDNGVVLTREAPQRQCLFIPRANPLWTMFHEKVRIDYEAARPIDLIDLSHAHETPESRLDQILERLGMLDFPPTSRANVLRAAARPKSPY